MDFYTVCAMPTRAGVAIRLQDQELKRTFLAALPVKELRERDVGAG